MAYNVPASDEQFKLYSAIEDIVEDIQDDSGKPFFHQGFWRELASNLQQLKGAKFPLIYLPIAYSETKEDNRVVDTVDFDLYIITESNQNYSTESRMTNIFEGVLDPIYEDLLTAILDNKWFTNPNRYLPHKRENMPYLGAEESNRLNRVIDAIYLSFSGVEITNLKDY